VTGPATGEGAAVAAEQRWHPPTSVRAFVGVLLVLLLVPGLVGFDAWPLTAWRLFSAARGDTQTRWEIEAVAADGTVTPVDLDDLPIAFRNAEWPLSNLGGAGEERRDEVCRSLLAGVAAELEGTEALRIVRNERRQAERDGDWVVVEERQPFHACGTAAS
jgi:hypothetical protein